ncbi:MAG TPA: alpha-L-glutamate ligase, partial [Thermoanaerobaculia bacterium]|nr:alpha-L-glutamate ligase [Thermoanaerobaculia bacterium]
DDVHAQAVMTELTRLGRPHRLLNLAEFPMKLGLTARLDGDRSDFALTFADGARIPMDEVRAVWWRRPQAFGFPAELKDPASRYFAQSEANTAFHGMYQASEALWVNNVVRDATASHKPWQLKLAREAGLAIPETLITNDPEEARAFWHQYPGEVIYKPFLQTYHAWRETRKIRQEDEPLADAVRLTPVLFQRFVPAVCDLRVTVIGDRLFAAAARAEQYELDIRFNTDAKYQPHALPAKVEERLFGLMRRLGLEYGAVDFRLTPEGEYVFLEVNPAGQFLYIERATEQPIAAALAGHLARGVATSSEADWASEEVEVSRAA